MGKINADIPDELHKKLKHQRIDTGKNNNVILTDALRVYFAQLGNNKPVSEETTTFSEEHSGAE